MGRSAVVFSIALYAAICAHPAPPATAPARRTCRHKRSATRSTPRRLGDDWQTSPPARAMLLLPSRRPVRLRPILADEPGSWTQFVGWFP